MSTQNITSIKDLTRITGAHIAKLGRAFMMSPDAGAAGEKINLGFFEFYALGRGGVLGNVEGKVVADIFYFFNHDLVANIWDTSKTKVAPFDAALVYRDACAQWGRENLDGIADLDLFNDLSERIALAHQPTASALMFTGWRDIELPSDTLGLAAINLMLIIRELRGSAHVDAVKEVGLKPIEAVAANSPDMLGLFGWGEAIDGEPFKAQAAQAEDRTDELVRRAFEALDDAERLRFADIVAAIRAKFPDA